MRICIVGSSKKFFSGISAYTIVMANAFAEQGHKVSAVLLRNLVPLFLYPGRDRVGKGEYLLDFRPGIEVYNGLDWNAPASWYGAFRFLDKQKPDAIIMHWWTSSVAHMQLLLALKKRLSSRQAPLILEMHEVVDTLEEKIAPIRLYSRIAGRALLRLGEAYIVHSSEAKEAIVATYKIEPDKVHIIPHGPYNMYNHVDRQEARKRLKVNGFTILYFGMIRQYKGMPILIKAFSQLPAAIANNSHLVIAGEDWGDDPELYPALNSSPYRERILFQPGFIPDELVPVYFAAADVVVLPYLRTCGSGVASIAVAQGKPIITSDLATMREYLAEYREAGFCRAGDVVSLRDMLGWAYRQWQENGWHQQTNQPGLTWQDITNKYGQIIRHLQNGNN